jgi:hypothetical protein
MVFAGLREPVGTENLSSEVLIETELASMGMHRAKIATVANSFQFLIEKQSFFDKVEVLKALLVFLEQGVPPIFIAKVVGKGVLFGSEIRQIGQL